ncbi:hypothetical protein K438DRAFT_1767793 [Mycena galopus ATCC 62051]|nr:hypothetical protein K438DRAFT_1767793 [Mycena galopus ATCC 62051]
MSHFYRDVQPMGDTSWDNKLGAHVSTTANTQEAARPTGLVPTGTATRAPTSGFFLDPAVFDRAVANWLCATVILSIPLFLCHRGEGHRWRQLLIDVTDGEITSPLEQFGVKHRVQWTSAPPKEDNGDGDDEKQGYKPAYDAGDSSAGQWVFTEEASDPVILCLVTVAVSVLRLSGGPEDVD